MINFFKNMTNSKLLIIGIIAALLAFPFDLDFLRFMKSENLFMGLRLISFILIYYVIIKVIDNKTKPKPKLKK
jgi:hypothetical protein